MHSDDLRSGYRQPAQARAFGTAALAAGGALAALLLSIRLFSPPVPAMDAGRTVVFVVESIPLTRSNPRPPDPVVEPQPPAPKPPMAVAMTSAPTMAAPVAVNSPPASIASPSAAASAPVLAHSVAAQPVESPTRPAPVASEAAAADWRARLLGHLKRYRRYPRQAEAARQQGIARVAITLRRSGEVIAVELVHGSGYPLLDMEARTTVRRASPLPTVDDAVPGDPVTIEVPIDFALRR
ncbi:energy transducer TonB [uncultured Sphingomonas sp.]|uniref:energy transducer TonB n=1 Tax=uncultured Sphingomonas sp. TaxID=158754 RepID=UPI0025D7D698|nr:energy transducer TonB [uncultured Sphingomonas sp.]